MAHSLGVWRWRPASTISAAPRRGGERVRRGHRACQNGLKSSPLPPGLAKNRSKGAKRSIASPIFHFFCIKFQHYCWHAFFRFCIDAFWLHLLSILFVCPFSTIDSSLIWGWILVSFLMLFGCISSPRTHLAKPLQIMTHTMNLHVFIL